MAIELLHTYLPMDRRHAIAGGDELPVDATGSVLLADISGFTPLTEALVAGLGPRRGAEELTTLLNDVYTAIIDCVHRFGGSVVSFIGDALVSWFADDAGRRAAACGVQMQRTMKKFQAIQAPQGGRVSLAMKAAISAGPVRRFLVGNPEIQLLDILAGSTVDRLNEAEHVAERGEVVVCQEIARAERDALLFGAWRGRFGVVEGFSRRRCPWGSPAGAPRRRGRSPVCAV